MGTYKTALPFKVAGLLLGCCLLFAPASIAGDIAPGITVQHRTYTAPINEQPFFGFAAKSADQREGDSRFIANFAKPGSPTIQDGARRAIQLAWQAILGNDYATAAKRLNQAWLLEPRQSEITHLFAIVVQKRFEDSDYALELFATAAKLDAPAPTLPSDHARFLLILRRPADAIPLLRQGIVQTPDWAVPKANLAWALYQTGQKNAACQAVTAVSGKELESVANDMKMLASMAAC
jgi:Flp pilus assembly protein TadD